MIFTKFVLLITCVIMVSVMGQAEALQQTADKLNFSLERGEIQTLQWGIISDEDVMTTLEIRVEGSGSELLSFKNSIEAEPHKMVWIDFTVTVPDDYQNDIELRPAIFALQKNIDDKGMGGAIISLEMKTVTSIKIGDPPEPTQTPEPEPTQTPEPEPTQTPEPEPTQTPEPEPTRQSEPTTFNMEPTSESDKICGSGTELIDGVCKIVIDKEPESKGGGCLIATAAYGTELAPQVQFLREIRDNTVMSTSSGAAFMTGFNQLYYSFSPTIADWERENPLFQETVKAFITPMLSTLSIMTLADQGSELQILGLGLTVIALNLGIYVVAPTAITLTVRKKLKPKI